MDEQLYGCKNLHSPLDLKSFIAKYLGKYWAASFPLIDIYTATQKSLEVLAYCTYYNFNILTFEEPNILQAIWTEWILLQTQQMYDSSHEKRGILDNIISANKSKIEKCNM